MQRDGQDRTQFYTCASNSEASSPRRITCTVLTSQRYLFEKMARKAIHDEMLINAVQDYRYLWHVKSKTFKDLRARENA